MLFRSVQRLLQLARELVKSEYESGLRDKEVLLPGELGKNKLVTTVILKHIYSVLEVMS